jgi:predicted phage terminase large subunit-like protein
VFKEKFLNSRLLFYESNEKIEMKSEKTRQLSEELSKLSIATPGWLATVVSNKHWKYAPHLRKIDELLVSAVRDGSARIMINMPPRHGKSELISKYFPFWYLGNFPDKRLILTSYAAEFASSWGRKVRELIDIYGSKIFGIQIEKSKRSAHNFQIANHSGFMNCIGAGGQITGKGADLIIIDDPIKNDAEANSITIRDNIWQWYSTTCFTRLEPHGSLIIVMTRWHEDDLCGRIIKNEADDLNTNWRHLSLPAIAKEGDILGRQAGDALWEQRFPVEKLKSIHKTLGNYWFASLYQQEPSPSEGGIFNSKYFRYFEEKDGVLKLYAGEKIESHLLTKCRIFAVMDLSVSVSDKADYTVILIYAVTPDHDIAVLDIVRQRMEGAGHLALLQSIYRKWEPITIGIESVQYQKALVQQAKRKGLPVKELRPDKDKVSRALAIAARMEAGAVYFRAKQHWLADLENELIAFPNGKNDDQVDALAYIAAMIKPMSDSLPVGLSKNNTKKQKITKGF